MECKKLSHCAYVCDYHLVLPTKYRRKVFNEGIFAYFSLKIKEIGKHYPQIEFMELNHDKDHIHIFLSIPPTMSVGSAVRIIKSNTSKGLKKKFPYLKDVYWGTDGVWSDGYFVSTSGIDKKTIQEYIKRQGKQDAGQAKLVLG